MHLVLTKIFKTRARIISFDGVLRLIYRTMKDNIIIFINMSVVLTFFLTHTDSKHHSDGMCSNQLEHCNAPPILSDIPSNEEELKQYCTAFIRYSSCMLRWTYACNNPYVAFNHMTYDFCTNSSLYEGLKRHIECIYDAYKPHVDGQTDCRRLNGKEDFYARLQSLKSSERFKEFQEEAHVRITDEEYANITYLLYAFNDLGCFLDNLKCPNDDNDLADDIVLEVHARMYSRLIYWFEKLKRKTILMVNSDVFFENYLERMRIREAIVEYLKKCETINCKTYEDSTSRLLK